MKCFTDDLSDCNGLGPTRLALAIVKLVNQSIYCTCEERVLQLLHPQDGPPAAQIFYPSRIKQLRYRTS